MLIVRGDEFDEIFGLDIGVDEYILKLFSFNILIVRVNVVLRRIMCVNDNINDFNGLKIDNDVY